MSLINKMLSELEKHKKEHLSENGRLYCPYKPHVKNNQPPWLKKIIVILLLIIIIVSIGVGSIYFFRTKVTKRPHFFPPSTQVKTQIKTSAIQQPIPLPPIAPKARTTTITPPATSEPISVQLKSVAIDTKFGKTILGFVLTDRTFYYISHQQADQQQLMITLGNTILPNNLVIPKDENTIKSIQLQQDGKNTQANLILQSGTKIEVLQFIDKPEPQLQLVFFNPNLPLGTASPVKSEMAKTEIPLSPDQKADQQYQEILKLITKNDYSAASKQLTSLLSINPNFSKARELLATIMLKRNNIPEALTIINIGLINQPDYTPFIQLKGLLLAKQGNIPKAIAVLQQNLPPISSNPDYFAMLAALYQQNDQYMQAAQIYNQLAQQQPERATWWLGLGIALDSAGQPNAAQEAYQHALNAGVGLTPELKIYIESKIKS